MIGALTVGGLRHPTWRGQAVRQLTLGRALLLPFIIVVKPNVLPLPFGLTFWAPPLFVKAPLQVVVTCCGEVIATVTVQLVLPETVTEVL